MEKSPVAPVASPRAADVKTQLTEQVRDETLTALTTAGIIREAECEGFRNYLVSNEINSGDIFPVMAQLRGVAEQEQISTIANWGRAIAPVIKKRYALIPFADRLLGSASIFEKYGTILEAAAAVRCPLIFSEDTDVIGFGTINPVAGMVLGEFVTKYVNEQVGVSPFISMFLLDMASWQTICGRQFER